MGFWIEDDPGSTTAYGSYNEKRRPSVKESGKFRESKTTSPTAANTVANLELLPVPVVSRPPRSDTASRKRNKSVTVDRGLRVHWAAFKKKIGTGTAPSTSSVVDESIGDSLPYPRRMHESLDGDVDEVIVDRAWADEIKQSSITPSQSGESPDRMGGTNTDHESVAVHVEGFWSTSVPLVILRWRVWPAILGFFRLRFMDEKSESHYLKESWFFRKNLAIWSSLFFVLNWILAAAFIAKPPVLADKIFYYGVSIYHMPPFTLL